MWELIRENTRRSWILFISMGACLIILGYFLGAAWFGFQGGALGVFIALCVWGIMSIISFFSGDSILLAAGRAKEITHDIHPQLFNVVEEMKLAANLPVMPKVYIIPSSALNAFAVGRSPQKSSIAVTSGLLAELNRDELQGVIAHEMSHITNRDVLYMTFAGVMLGSIVILSEVFLRSMWFSRGSSRRYSSSSGGSGQAQLIVLVISLVFAILTPILARLFYFSLSRRREYLADASGVRLTRYPPGLASALEKISASGIKLDSANKITASMYIENPFIKKSMATQSLFSTHPPITERIKILRSMSGGVNYFEYQKAFSNVKGPASKVMPESALKNTERISLRAGLGKDGAKNIKEKTREAGDLIRALNKYVFLYCACGLKIKIPPDFKNKHLQCPRCSRKLEIPKVDLKIAGALLEGIKKDIPQQQGHQEYIRQHKGWETFLCSCKKPIQLSPAYIAPFIRCENCGRKINIVDKS
ncbi:MAG: M48 family metallopeptidase [Candidatus Omnitrophica bacterium]|nr:M48 family metallopeptidase [Candidatus Omnitrophota bacterium]MDD5430140.1 M48 family metallopeptidase [Candidatus Omnitrophota bacterium]